MNSNNCFSTLKSLLSSEPRSASSTSPLLTETNNNNNFCKLQHNDDVASTTATLAKTALNHKEKKKAAFENWHKRKLDELQRKVSVDSTKSDSEHADVGSPSPPASNSALPDLPLKPMSRDSTTSKSSQQSNISLIQQLVQANATVPTVDFATALYPNTRPVTANRSSSSRDVAPVIHNGCQPLLSASTSVVGKDLTSPKLSRHNDAAFYPNIQCILCKEWVCSRNRYMHIESHLQYRPYKCSVCNYDNRKKIFIELHINRVHKGASTVDYHPDPELEKRAWVMAEQCLQHTREVLLNGGGPAANNKEKKVDNRESKVQQQQQQQTTETKSPAAANQANVNRPILDKSILAPYEDVYRPKIFNSQRNEKSQLIEESRQLGLVPDFSEVANREERCQLCNSYILRIPGLLEEHVRSHVSQPTYQCSFEECTIRHCSRNFLFRHMKEVHKTRKNVKDLIHTAPQLIEEFALLCQICFPAFYRSEANVLKRKLQADALNKAKRLKVEGVASSALNGATNNAAVATTDCPGCRVNLNLCKFETSCAECCTVSSAKPKGRLFCNYCSCFVPGEFAYAQVHALEHCDRSPPFACKLCSFTTVASRLAKNHASEEHATSAASAFDFDWSKKSDVDWRAAWWTTLSMCFDRDFFLAARGTSGTPMLGGEISCRLCCSRIGQDYRSLLDHTLKHLSCPKFACLYCDFENSHESEIQVHLRLQHAKMAVVVRIDVVKECMEERDRLMSLCFPEAGCPAITMATTPVSGDVGNRQQNESSSSSAVDSNGCMKIVCKLCQHALSLEENECLRHVQGHLTDSVYQCHFCVHKAVNANRMKTHTENFHNNASSFSKLTLPTDLSVKFAQVMAFCFSNDA